MKKFICLFVLTSVALLLVGCTNNVENEEMGVILDKIITRAGKLDTDKEYGIATIENVHQTIKNEEVEDNLGVTLEEYQENIAEFIESRPNEAYITHSVILMKVKDGVDTASMAQKLTENISPYRFSTVPAEIMGAYTDKYIIIVTSEESTVDAVIKAFEEVIGKSTKIERTNDWSDSMFE